MANEAVKRQAQRFALALVIAVVAITFILPLAMEHAPHSVRESVFRLALPPAAAAWLVLWPAPGSHNANMLRAAMLTLMLVGAGCLGLHSAVESVSPWIREIVQQARFVPQSLVYLGVGSAGLIGSLFVGSGNSPSSD